MKSEIGNQTEKATQLVGFGVNDTKGREIGARIQAWQVDFVAAPEDTHAWYNIEAGHYFALNTWATRNQTPYGAIQQNKYFKTESERTQEIARYLRYAQKKAGVK